MLVFVASRTHILTSSGVMLSPAAAQELDYAFGQLFRGGVPYRPWPPFLDPPEDVKRAHKSLREALATLGRP